MTIMTFRRMSIKKVSGSVSPPSRRPVESSSSFYKPNSTKKCDDAHISQDIRRESTLRRLSGKGLRDNKSSSSKQMDLSSTQSKNDIDDSSTSVTSTSSNSEQQPIAKKTVTFDKIARVKRVKPRYYYTEEQHRKMWYDDDDYADIKNGAVETVKMMMKSTRSGDNFVDDDDYTSRGLECRTRVAATERKQFKEYARLLVLDEQEDQDELGFRSVTRLRRMYLKASNVSSAKARELGQKDAEAANDDSLQEILALVRQEHASSQ
mmetsp:Transcript_919/g.1968  ORF Transcript_919/g.1968 Transcript_919/m.1968 type:complete len:264 (-) Transcript_919:90-881(-)